MNVVGSFSPNKDVNLNANVNPNPDADLPERKNIIFTIMGWLFGVSGIFGAIVTLLMVFGMQAFFQKLGIGIFKGQASVLNIAFIFSAICAGIAGILILPPVLRKFRAKYSFLRPIYAAPLIYILLGFVGKFPVQHFTKQIVADKIAMSKSAQLSPNHTQIPDVKFANSQDTENSQGHAAPEQPKSNIEKIGLRGTYYGR